KKLRKFDQQGGFSGMEYPQSLWYGVLYDPNKKRVQVAGRDLAAKLLVYILGGIQEHMERAELRKALADARTVEDKTIGFDGKFVEPKEVGLPPIL
ncbi:MAG: DGQHR domain-containing protein, partial [Nostoc sp.]